MSPSDIDYSGRERVNLADEDGVKTIVTETIAGLWDLVNNLTRLEASTKDRYRVTIFGSARSKPGSVVYDDVKHVARTLAELGCDIITGGGPGLMQAANEGAAEGGASDAVRSVGIRIHLPFEQDANPYVAEAFTHQTFFTRLHHFVPEIDRRSGTRHLSLGAVENTLDLLKGVE